MLYTRCLSLPDFPSVDLVMVDTRGHFHSSFSFLHFSLLHCNRLTFISSSSIFSLLFLSLISHYFHLLLFLLFLLLLFFPTFSLAPSSLLHLFLLLHFGTLHYLHFLFSSSHPSIFSCLSSHASLLLHLSLLHALLRPYGASSFFSSPSPSPSSSWVSLGWVMLQEYSTYVTLTSSYPSPFFTVYLFLLLHSVFFLLFFHYFPLSVIFHLPLLLYSSFLDMFSSTKYYTHFFCFCLFPSLYFLLISFCHFLFIIFHLLSCCCCCFLLSPLFHSFPSHLLFPSLPMVCSLPLIFFFVHIFSFLLVTEILILLSFRPSFPSHSPCHSFSLSSSFRPSIPFLPSFLFPLFRILHPPFHAYLLFPSYLPTTPTHYHYIAPPLDTTNYKLLADKPFINRSYYLIKYIHDWWVMCQKSRWSQKLSYKSIMLHHLYYPLTVSNQLITSR
ncbi:uncharacterized protein LOC126986395 [Eriocheir sinensis]|uniref:uncharacterized protein LOC126986395 n=1 Tax=Eriocheir sinensis TaxID=95602 RepID=UPI0021C5F0FB|nr:uncharacterized protein LOC126986395 [Eriocheir sinensis]